MSPWRVDARGQQARVVRIFVVDGPDRDRRRGDDFDPVGPGDGVAGLDAVGKILLQRSLARRQHALVLVAVGRHVHGDGAVDDLAVGRAVEQRHAASAGQTLHAGRHGQLLAAKRPRVAGREFVDHGAGGSVDIGPGHGHAAHGAQQVLRRQQGVERADEEDRHQGVAQPHQLRAVDGRIDRHLRQVRGRLGFDRLVNHRVDAGAIVAKQQEIHQRVFQRWSAALDRVGRVHGVDAPHDEWQHFDGQVPAAGGQVDHQEGQPRPKPQSTGHQPMIDQGGQQKIDQAGGRQDHQMARDVDAAHLAARFAQLAFDELLVFDHLGARIARRAGGSSGGRSLVAGSRHAFILCAAGSARRAPIASISFAIAAPGAPGSRSPRPSVPGR